MFDYVILVEAKVEEKDGMSGTRTALRNCRALTSVGVVPSATVLVRGNEIELVSTSSDVTMPSPDEEYDCDGALVTPGLIDVQINGGGGRMFSTDVDQASYIRILEAHARLGSTGVCPTIISGPVDDMVRAVSLAAELCENGKPEADRARILGIHVEGPFLSAEKRGGHAAGHLLLPNVEVASRLIEAGRGYVRILTLAPELPGADEVIRFAVARGVLVSIGHTKATAKEAERGFGLGATGATHLFNGMEGLTSRAPGAVGAALISPNVYAGLIADMLHVDPFSVLSAVRAKGCDRMYLTTDAVSPLGADAESFDLYGVTVTVRDGGCYTDSGVLAGTATPLAVMVRNLISTGRLSVADAFRMATSVPAEWLGLSSSCGSLRTGSMADLVVWKDDFTPSSVWIAGNRIAMS
jgi:N-acetylglucosamine-6-phosphate deacetylase